MNVLYGDHHIEAVDWAEAPNLPSSAADQENLFWQRY
jgi:hypothetical protein